MNGDGGGMSDAVPIIKEVQGRAEEIIDFEFNCRGDQNL